MIIGGWGLIETDPRMNHQVVAMNVTLRFPYPGDRDRS